MSLIDQRPSFSVADAASLFEKSFGLVTKSLQPLPGERDQNFLTKLNDGRSYVFKISNANEPRGFLEAQNVVLKRVQPSCDFIPRSLSLRDGRLLGTTVRGNTEYLIRAIDFLPGTPLVQVRKPSRYLLSDLGRKLARLDRAMQGFDHPSLHRDFDWNLLHGIRVVRQYAHLIDDAETRHRVHEFIARVEPRFDEFRPKLRQAAIHNDANDHNVIVSPDRDKHGERCVGGIIDFGDMAWSFLIAELAISIAYVVCRRVDWLNAACEVVAGYHEVSPLEEIETACLFDLALLRLCVSACMSAFQQRERPDDAYYSVSQEPIRRAMPALSAVHPRFVECRFRQVCGFEPHPASHRISSWIHQRRHVLFPVMGTRLGKDNADVIDLSPASPRSEAFARSIGESESVASARRAPVQASDGRYAIGRHNEPRLIYASELFSSPQTREIDERRTIHLGIDIFAPAGTKIFAPLEGDVVVSEFRGRDQDYGGLVVLQHQADEGEPFQSLYGHLARSSVDRIRVGDRVSAGEILAQLGTAGENGGWTPHLHVQLIVDPLEQAGDFPGVAFASEREVWTSLSPNPSAFIGIDDGLSVSCRVAPCETTLRERRYSIGPSLSVAYRQPLAIARGWMQYLFDDSGRRFLDAYNNVPHVGHCHPRVVREATRQMATLNTNTRYLHGLLQEFAGRIADTLPDPLHVCYFVNSASEANELALRLARTTTGRQGMIVQESAYHGHTSALIDMSPYKHDGPGGKGTPEWVHKLPLPDRYRGLFRGHDRGANYAADAAMRIARFADSPFPPAALIAETFPSVAGQIFPPDNYYPIVYKAAHAIGALTIADEVQTGLGRLGTHFWGFEKYGVIPDIVVMGKPMGNGHPIAAVVTTPAIADQFNNGMEFFSTFGGNTVSCAVGIAVLDVLRDENLQAHALATGSVLEVGFQELAARHPMIGDVRGSGLFWGLELVRNRETLEAADGEAALISNRMREAGILIGTDGPLHNVLKVRPPMQFNHDNAETLVDVLGRILNDEFDET